MGSRTSPYLQEKLTLLGCENIFNAVPKVVESLLGIEVNETQVYRICQAASLELPDSKLNSPSNGLNQIEIDKKECVYGMIDGSMLQMDQGWQETKVGRVFKAELVKNRAPLRWEIGVSEYVANRGHCSEFIEKFEQLLPPESACKKVFITDGAQWMGKWLSENYPNATHILDFFHVCEKLAVASKSDNNSEKWLKKQKDRLLMGKQKKVYKSVQKLENYDLDAKTGLLNYLNNNAYRMKYDEYRQRGIMISSGPIESAHRTVLQVRMKRSGQHWSEKGCDNMIKLRVAYRSEKFELITQIFKKQAA
jgi:Transposase